MFPVDLGFYRLISLLLIILLLTACGGLSSQPLPTLMPLAMVPVPKQKNILPATFTPVPTPENLPTVTPSPLPLPTFTPTPLPIPTATIPATAAVSMSGGFSGGSSANASYLNGPPSTIDCDGNGILFRSQFPSGVGGPWRYYHAYLPPCYGHDGRVYPLLYLFHGSIQTDSHWPDLGLASQVDAGIKDGRYPPFIAIMPYNGSIGNSTSGNDHSIEGITVNYLIPYIDATYCSWQAAAGRGIGGISRGGYWALEIAFRHTDLFSAVSGHSSHLRFETDEARYNPLATYARANLSHMRIWLDWGETDFLRPGQQQLHQSLADAGIIHQAFVNSGGHNDAYWLVHLAEYLNWHTAVWPRNRGDYPPCTH